MLEGRDLVGLARKVMRKSWSSPPNTCATVAPPTRQRVPVQAGSWRHRGRDASTASMRSTHSSGTSGRSARATAHSLPLAADNG